MEKIGTDLNFESCLTLELSNRSGGFSLLWKSALDISIHSYSSYYIDCLVEGTSSCILSQTFIGVYREARVDSRHNFWSLLQKQDKGNSVVWLCTCDFNEIMDHQKKGSVLKSSSQMDQFIEVIKDIRIHYIRFRRKNFT